MKQHDRHTDEALYQQIVAELKPGAEEYDRMMASGKHPAVTKRRSIPYYKYVAAACVLLAIVGGTWFMHEMGGEKPQAKQMTQVGAAESHFAGKPHHLPAEKVQQMEEPVPPHNQQQQICQSRAHTSRHLPPEETARPIESTPSTSNDMTDEELYLTLRAEVEARTALIEQEEQLSTRALLNELIENIEQQSNRPQLSL